MDLSPFALISADISTDSPLSQVVIVRLSITSKQEKVQTTVVVCGETLNVNQSLFTPSRSSSS